MVDKDGYECFSPAPAVPAKAKLGAFDPEHPGDPGFGFDVFRELRARDEARRLAALGAAERDAGASRARGGLLAAGGAAVVAGAFAVKRRARRRDASDAERLPLIADGV